MASTSTKEDLLGTRQLLDELDALMNQMLAVPVEDAEQVRSGETPGEGAPTVAATLTMLGNPPDLESAEAHREMKLSPTPALPETYARDAADLRSAIQAKPD